MNNIKKEILEMLNIDENLLVLWQNTNYSADIRVSLKMREVLDDTDIIIIAGDYDCDGLCATHITETACKELYKDKKIYTLIPTRKEGYGLNERIVNFCKNKTKEGKVCVITVDTGIKEKNKLEEIKKSGCKVILTDHHILQNEEDLPNVDLIIDPNVSFIENPLVGTNWCGASVIYKIFENLVSPDISKYLMNFAGIATIADIITLREGSWQLVKRTLNNLHENAPFNLQLLTSVLGRDIFHLSEDDIGYYIAPAFNAPGRLEYDSKMVLDFLNNPTGEKAQELKEINDERKEIRDNELELVINKIHQEHKENDNPIWVYIPDLHEGIVGILAGHVLEEFKTSACICTDDENGNIKGSSRSYGSFDMYEYLERNQQYLLKWGGHKGAAGFTLTKENYQKISKDVKEKEIISNVDTPPLSIDLVDIPYISRMLSIIRPFGEGYREPIFETDINLAKCKYDVRYIGENKNHLSINNNVPKYKLIHFYHKEDEKKLSDKNKFKAYGRIHNSYYKNFCTPEMLITDIEDISINEHEHDLTL